MTKKERAAFDAALRKARVLGALRWTADVIPDVPVPRDGLTTGWLFAGNRVDVACSSSVFHAFGQTHKTTTQNPRALFSTKLRALQALRHSRELDFAEKLACIDEQIAQEQPCP